MLALTVALASVGWVSPASAYVLERAGGDRPQPAIAAVQTLASVDARIGWQSTLVLVDSNQPITITVISGTWTHWLGTIPYNPGLGGSYTCGNATCIEPIPTALTGMLIGSIGGQRFPIGSGTTQVSGASGPLLLRINDGDVGLHDNDGILTVQIDAGQGLGPDRLFLPTLLRMPPAPLVTKTVFAIAYMDAVPIFDPAEIQEDFIAALRRASSWHGHSNPEAIPALGYQTYQNTVLKLNEAPPHRTDNGKFDYAAVYQRFDLCTKIQAGLIDEVWIWESGTGNAWEWVTHGPHWSWRWDANVPDCGRTVTTMNLNYQREVDLALHSYGHRLEGAFMTWRPCDFYTETWPWTGWPRGCAGLVSDRLGYVARPMPGNDNVGVCGDIHHPPNILDSRDYLYDERTTARSICNDWHWTGPTLAESFDCEAWGCTQGGYMIWWMQNIPWVANTSRDRGGAAMPNWWSYLFLDQRPPAPGLAGLDAQQMADLADYFHHPSRDLDVP